MSWFQKIFSLPANVKFGHSKNFKDFQEYKLIGEYEDSILALLEFENAETSISLRNSTAELLFSAFLPG